jgi:hypothetical protein
MIGLVIGLRGLLLILLPTGLVLALALVFGKAARTSATMRGRAGRVLLAAAGLAAVVVVVLGLILPITWHVSRSAGENRPRAPLQQDAGETSASEPGPDARAHIYPPPQEGAYTGPDPSEAVLQFQPQPSLRWALRQASEAMAEELAGLYDADSNVKVFVEVPDDPEMHAQISEPFRRLTQPSLLTDLADGGTDIIVLRCEVDAKDEPKAVRLIADLPRGQGSLSRHVRFVEKPWVFDLDLDAYVNDSDSHWHRVDTVLSGVHPTRQQALDDLSWQVARTLLQDVEHAMGLHADPAVRSYYSSVYGSREIHSDLANLVRSSKAWADEFVQVGQRSYGTLYRAWALVRLSDAVMEDLTVKLEKVYLARVRTESRKNLAITRIVLALAALLLGISMLYLLANAATRGYYTWVLRAVAAVAVLVGSFVVLHLLAPSL